MPANKKPEAQGRTAMMSLRIDADLYEKYKAKLKANGISITESIESHMRDYIGEVVIESNVVDIASLLEDVEKLKQQAQAIEELQQIVGELNPGWHKKTNNLKAS